MNLLMNQDLFEYEIRGLMLGYFPGQKFETEPGEMSADGLTVNYRSENEEDYTCSFSLKLNGSDYVRDCAFSLADKKTAKTVVKKNLYTLLSDAFGKKLPWGTLTGIRPTKIPMAMLREGKTEVEILFHMEEELLVSEEKSALALDIAKRENALLSKLDAENGYSLYVGIPFCPSICLYCSFSSYPLFKYEKVVWDYLYALEKELDYAAETFRGKTLNTVYFGGGTPTTLSHEQLDWLLGKITEKFDLSNCLEWTVEAGRPDSVTREKLEVLKKYPVTRISVNPQTMHQKTLDLIGRKHTVDQILEVYKMAREMDFTNINMDLILGLPGETEEDIRETMEKVAELHPDNVTVHSLALKRAARLNLFKDAYKEYRMNNSDDLMDMCREKCREMGEYPYYLYRQKNMAGNQENVGYAVHGKEGIYNILIMEEVQTIVACGSGTVTKRVFPDGRIERCDTVKDVNLYIREIEEMIERKKNLFAE